MIWDLSNGGLVTQLQGHSDCIYSLDFSREGSVLASGIEAVSVLFEVRVKVFAIELKISS